MKYKHLDMLAWPDLFKLNKKSAPRTSGKCDVLLTDNDNAIQALKEICLVMKISKTGSLRWPTPLMPKRKYWL